jgi:hypothetical protein
MSKYIDADELKNYVKKLICSDGANVAYRDGVNNAICNLLPQIIDSMPAADVEPVVHSHITGGGYDLHCSICGESADIGNNYCPYCGAKMDEKYPEAGGAK